MTPERVQLMKRVRRLLREGRGNDDIIALTGVVPGEIAAQRALIGIADGTNRDRKVLGHSQSGRRAWVRRSKACAEAVGDLCDIIAANASRSDFRFGFTGRD